MRQWGNSKELTRASYGLVKENPGMYRWTIRAAVHGAVVGGLGVLVGLGLVALGAAMADGSAGPLGIVVVVLGVLLVLGGMIGGLTAANTQLAGLVSATDDVLHGRELDEDAARSAAHSRFRALAAWSAISVGVNAIVSMISGDGDSGFAVTIVRSLLAGLVAAVWAVVTTLVMPVIVLEDAHAVAAIKRSASIIRGTWGEAVLGSVRIGARFGLMFSLPGALLLVGGAVLGFTFGGADDRRRRAAGGSGRGTRDHRGGQGCDVPQRLRGRPLPLGDRRRGARPVQRGRPPGCGAGQGQRCSRRLSQASPGPGYTAPRWALGSGAAGGRLEGLADAR